MSSDFNSTTGSSTSNFNRNFNAGELQASGLWLDRGHNIPRFQLGSYKSEFTANSAFGFTGQSNIRDLTQVGWIKTNAIVALNQAGMVTLDGTTPQLNSASSITSTSSNATVLFPTSIASSSRTFSAYVKRLAGNGSIYITRDGGATWTDISSQITNTSYVRVTLTSAVANPSFGFKIANSGDSIAVDLAIDEDSSMATSPMWTIGVRNNDNLSFSGLTGIDPGKRYRYTANIKITNDTGGSFGLQASINGSNIAQVGYSPNSGMYSGYRSVVINSSGIQVSDNPLVSTSINVFHSVSGEFGMGQARVFVDGQLTSPETNSQDPVGLDTLSVGGYQEINSIELDKINTLNNVVFLGDSITALATYPNEVRSHFPGLDYIWRNFGNGGETILSTITRIPSVVTPFYEPNATTNTLILMIGTNSLSSGVSGAIAITQLQSLVNAIHASGNWNIVLITTLNRNNYLDNGLTPTQFDAQAAIYNAAQLNGTITGVAQVIDAASIPQLVDPTNTTYFSDGLHPNATGGTILGDYVAAHLTTTAAPVINSIASSVSSTSATITYNTDVTATSTIRYGLNMNYGSFVSNDVGTTTQVGILTGLSTCATYHYQIAVANVIGNTLGTSTDQTFTTTGCPTPAVAATPTISSGGGGSAVSSAVLATLLAPSAATTAYLNSLKGTGQSTVVVIPLSTTPPSPVSISTLTTSRDLTLGAQSTSVQTLQAYLNSHGFTVAVTGAGSPGHETLYFGTLTRTALAKFQKANGITPAVGYFGPITKAKMKSLGY